MEKLHSNYVTGRLCVCCVIKRTGLVDHFWMNSGLVSWMVLWIGGIESEVFFFHCEWGTGHRCGLSCHGNLHVLLCWCKIDWQQERSIVAPGACWEENRVHLVSRGGAREDQTGWKCQYLATFVHFSVGIAHTTRAHAHAHAVVLLVSSVVSITFPFKNIGWPVSMLSYYLNGPPTVVDVLCWNIRCLLTKFDGYCLQLMNY